MQRRFVCFGIWMGTVLGPVPWAAVTPAADPQPLPEVKAFPTAEGFGAHARGGRGGRVLEVTNLNDSGEGSLRWAMEASGRAPKNITLHHNLYANLGSRTPLIQHADGFDFCNEEYMWRPNVLLDRPLRESWTSSMDYFCSTENI